MKTYIRKFFLFTLSFFFLLWGISSFAVNPKIQQQVNEIDYHIAELQEMKRGYESRALRHENQAEYLQFEQQAVLETRRHLQLAEENRRKAAEVQQKIDQLEAQKMRLLKGSS